MHMLLIYISTFIAGSNLYVISYIVLLFIIF
jgi:hypothetical protein